MSQQNSCVIVGAIFLASGEVDVLREINLDCVSRPSFIPSLDRNYRGRNKTHKSLNTPHQCHHVVMVVRLKIRIPSLLCSLGPMEQPDVRLKVQLVS